MIYTAPAPLLGPTGRHALSPDHPNSAYIVKHQFVSYNISTLVTCVRFYGGARRGLCGVDDAWRPRHPKLRATLATSPRRHSLIRDWNICKYLRDLHHLGCGNTEEMKTKRMTGPLLHSPLSIKIQDVLQFSDSLDPVFFSLSCLRYLGRRADMPSLTSAECRMMLLVTLAT